MTKEHKEVINLEKGDVAEIKLQNVDNTISLSNIDGDVIKGVSLMSLGEASGHGFVVDKKMLSSVVTASKKESSIKVHLSHPGIFGGIPKELLYLGTISNIKLLEERVIGDFTFSKVASNSPLGGSNLKENILSRLEEEETSFGFSARISGKSRDLEEPIDGFDQSLTVTGVHGFDIVENPATNNTFFFSKKLKEIEDKVIEASLSKEDVKKLLLTSLKEHFKIEETIHTDSKGKTNVNEDQKKKLLALTKLSKRYNLSQEKVTELALGDSTLDDIITQLDTNFQEPDKEGEVDLSIKLTVDEKEKKQTQLTRAILHQQGIKDKTETYDTKGLNEYGLLSLQGLYRQCCSLSNNIPGMTAGVDQMFSNIMLSGTNGQGSDDFVNILSNVLNKSLLAGYTFAEMSFEKLVGRRSFKDFKQNDMLRITEFSTFEEMPNGTAPKEGAFNDQKESARLATHGRRYTLDRKALYNDDLGAFSIIPQAMARSLKRYQNYIFWTKLYGTTFAGPAMNEVSNLFTAGAGNLVAPGSGAAPSSTTLNTAYLYFRRLKAAIPLEGDVPNIKLNIKPKYLVIPPQYEFEVNALTHSLFYNVNTSIKDGSQISNIYSAGGSRGFDTIIEGTLEDLNSTYTYPWYFFADPAIAPTMNFITLQGAETPYFVSEPTKTGDARGILWVMEIDFQFAPEDYRGAYCNAGS